MSYQINKKSICTFDGESYLVNLMPLELFMQFFEDMENDFLENSEAFHWTPFLVCSHKYQYGLPVIKVHSSDDLEKELYHAVFENQEDDMGNTVRVCSFAAQTNEEEDICGFRPVLIPLNKDGEMDSEALDAKDGELVYGGSLAFNPEAVCPLGEAFVKDTADEPIEWIVYHHALIPTQNLCQMKVNDALLNLYCESEF